MESKEKTACNFVAEVHENHHSDESDDPVVDDSTSSFRPEKTQRMLRVSINFSECYIVWTFLVPQSRHIQLIGIGGESSLF